jgi:hypothetical protein
MFLRHQWQAEAYTSGSVMDSREGGVFLMVDQDYQPSYKGVNTP